MPGPADEQTLSARWVFPVSGPPLPGGTVTVRGDRIYSADPAGARTPDLDFGNAAIIPGLVNAHTHLDLTGAAGSCRRGRTSSAGCARSSPTGAPRTPTASRPSSGPAWTSR